MKCENDLCHAATWPEKQYQWPKRMIKEGERCFLNTRIIESRYKSDLILNDCNVKTGVCRKENSIMVWKPENIIHDCPYQIFGVREFNVTGNILRSLNPNIALEVTDRFESCNRTIYSTTEGFYLTFNETEGLENSEKDQDTIT